MLNKRYKNIIGNKYGRLTAIKFAYKKKGKSYWLFNCECKKNKIIQSNNVTAGKIVSCGCYLKEIRPIFASFNFTNREGGKGRRTAEYRTWASMKSRCNNPKNYGYKNYGGRRIKVCKRWNRYENFLVDMGRKPSNNHSIERIDNNKGYFKKNCKWATRKEQNRNKRGVYLYNGETASDASKRLGMTRQAICFRIESGWPIKLAFSIKKITLSQSGKLKKNGQHKDFIFNIKNDLPLKKFLV